jgi:hypothetical protein
MGTVQHHLDNSKVASDGFSVMKAEFLPFVETERWQAPASDSDAVHDDDADGDGNFEIKVVPTVRKGPAAKKPSQTPRAKPEFLKPITTREKTSAAGTREPASLKPVPAPRQKPDAAPAKAVDPPTSKVSLTGANAGESDGDDWLDVVQGSLGSDVKYEPSTADRPSVRRRGAPTTASAAATTAAGAETSGNDVPMSDRNSSASKRTSADTDSLGPYSEEDSTAV